MLITWFLKAKLNRFNSAEMPLQNIIHSPGKVWSIPGKGAFKPAHSFPYRPFSLLSKQSSVLFFPITLVCCTCCILRQGHWNQTSFPPSIWKCSLFSWFWFGIWPFKEISHSTERPKKFIQAKLAKQVKEVWKLFWSWYWMPCNGRKVCDQSSLPGKSNAYIVPLPVLEWIKERIVPQ